MVASLNTSQPNSSGTLMISDIHKHPFKRCGNDFGLSLEKRASPTFEEKDGHWKQRKNPAFKTCPLSLILYQFYATISQSASSETAQFFIRFSVSFVHFSEMLL
jgi:hypothetical protein